MHNIKENLQLANNKFFLNIKKENTFDNKKINQKTAQ